MTAPTTIQPGPPPKRLTSDELAVHKRNAMRMVAGGQSPAAIAAYLDSVGVPRKRPVAYPPEVDANPGMVGGMLLSVLQGATFGFGDEAVGAIMGLVTDKTVGESIDLVRQQVKTFQGEHPVLSTVGQIGGIVGSGGGVVGLAARGAKAALPGLAGRAASALGGAGMPGRIAATAGSAGAAGAVQAAGDVEGGLGERLGAVPRGAAIGGVLGGAMSGVAGAAGTILRPVARKIPAIGAKLPGVRTADDQADELLRRALARDGQDLDDLIAKARGAAAKGQPMTLMDVAGENTVGLASAAQSVPGQAKQELAEGLLSRQQDQGTRLLDVLSGKAKMGLANVYTTQDKLLANRAAQANALYGEARKFNVQLDDEMKSLIKHPVFRQAYETGRTIAATEDKQLPLLIQKGAPSGEEIKAMIRAGTPLDKIGRADRVADELPIEAIDYMKRGLDKLIEKGQAGKFAIDRAGARTLRGRLEQFLERVDQKVPAYQQARAAYRGDSEVINALQMGRDEFLSAPAEAVPGVMKGFKSAAEREAYRFGALKAIQRRIDEKTADAPDIARGIFGSKSMEAKMRHLFGPDAQDVIDAIRTEKRMSTVFRGVLSGSRTTPLAKSVEALQGESSVLGSLASGRVGVIETIVRGAARAEARARTGFAEEVSDALSTKLSRGLDDPNDLVGLLMGLKATRRAAETAVFRPGAAAIGAQVAR